jgi:hypothetical protein
MFIIIYNLFIGFENKDIIIDLIKAILLLNYITNNLN